MTSLQEMNPISAFLWLLTAVGIAMFSFNPILLGISVLGAALYFCVRNPDAGLKSHAFYIAIFAVTTLANPLFSHSGSTVLFVMNNNPITLEAVYYGMILGGMIVAVMYWFKSFQQIMTTDKLLYVFGSALPKLTLMLSVSLRYVPLLKKQTKKIRDAQKALGLFTGENLIDRLRGELRIFSVLVSWALENGIITADSMSARGYGIKRRSRFALFRFQLRDAIACLICLLLGGFVVYAMATVAVSCIFYPVFTVKTEGVIPLFTYVFYAIIALAPSFLELEEKIRWKSLKSKI